MKINRDFKDNEYIKEISVKEFVESGGLWLANQVLHTFGMAITYNPDDMSELKPAICRFRGFDPKSNDLGYQRISEYMKVNIDDITRETYE